MTKQVGGEYKGFYKAMPAPGAIVLLALFLVPLFFTLSTAFLTEEGFSLSRIQQTFTSAYTIRILLFTLYQAALSTLASVLVALPGAYLLANYSFKGRRFIRALTTVPFVIPSILVVLGFVIFFGNNGFLNQLLMKAFFPLLDTALSVEELAKLKEILKDLDVNYHDLRTRAAGHQRFVEFHLDVPPQETIETIHRQCDIIEERIGLEFSDISVVIHPEPKK